MRGLDGARFRRLASPVFSRIVAVTEGSSSARVGRVLDHEHTDAYRELAATFEAAALAAMIPRSSSQAAVRRTPSTRGTV